MDFAGAGMSGEILFLSHRMPFPPDRGDKIRSHHVLRKLATLAPVHVATFADDERDIAEEVELASIARSYRLVRRVKPLIVAGMQSLMRRQPVSVPAFSSAEIAKYVAAVLAEHPISMIYAFSGQMGQFIPASFTGKVVFDFVDVDSAKFEAYADEASGIRRWLFEREGRLLAHEEARIAARSDVSLLVSSEEAALFRLRLPAEQAADCDVRTLRNGIDSRFFDPAIVSAASAMAASPGPRLIFVGQMDYAPNVTAALRVIDRLLPAIRETLPKATFHIVGRNPDEQLVEYHGKNGVFVWGGVDDIRAYLAAADLALIPLEIARGVQNKVLEAMAMSLPVVLTSQAATGIGAVDGEHLAIADSDEDLVDRVTALLAHPRQALTLGHEARNYVVEKMSWQAALAPLVDLVSDPAAEPRHAA
ncbi:TIGR03087 family PEP-CTERM/XrtA system glycosyltransferase [Novosphingobium aquiterrae]|uniref:TIGR03087 family PEP-CTERM/XrtA system glycosyltransferase n=1 Tax=Novosphingobium aquiterrae TaxID=624388 RepID=A0ABV6PGY9_9SPHN